MNDPGFIPAIAFLGGLVIFLLGLERIGSVLQLTLGRYLKGPLHKRLTDHWVGLLNGALLSAFVQSSSATTALLIGYATSDLITLSQAVGVLLGSEIGTSVVLQVAAWRATPYALLLVALGFALASVPWWSGKLRQAGHLMTGLGLFFFGEATMSESLTAIGAYPALHTFVTSLEVPFFAFLFAAIATALLQSSAAAMGATMALAMQGMISLEAGIWMILGSLGGSCFTAMMDAHGKTPRATRVALAHLLLRLGAIGVAILLLPLLQGGARWLTADLPRQIANTHLMLTTISALLFLPLLSHLDRLCQWAVTEPPDEWNWEGDENAPPEEESAYQPQYLDSALLDSPGLALSMVRREIQIMAHTLNQMLSGIPEAIFHGDLHKSSHLRRMDDQVDEIHHAITQYLTKVAPTLLSPRLADELLAALTVSSEIEAIGDIIETNLAHIAEVCAEEGVILDDEEIAQLTQFHDIVQKAFIASAEAFVVNHLPTAEQVMLMKDEINAMDITFRSKQIQDLQEGRGTARLTAYSLQMDIRENLKRIYYHAKRIAKLVSRSEDVAAWSTASSPSEESNEPHPSQITVSS